MDILSKQLKTTVIAINTPLAVDVSSNKEINTVNPEIITRVDSDNSKTSAHDYVTVTVTIVVITTVITNATNTVKGTRYQNDQ